MAVMNVSALSSKTVLSSNFPQVPSGFRYNTMLFSCIDFSWKTRRDPVLARLSSSEFAAKSWGLSQYPMEYGQTSRPHSLRCRVEGKDSEEILSSESIILDEQTLEQNLQIAIKQENYAQAAKIRDSLRVLHEDSKASVLAANARFYNSFRSGDLASMQALWAKGENVCCVHPGVSGISGYDLVMGSWEYVWADYEFPLAIELKNIEVHVRGDYGYVTCMEVVRTKGSNWGRQFATNVFERIDGQWFICIHHASYIDL